jgi:hypothetical protein
LPCVHTCIDLDRPIASIARMIAWHFVCLLHQGRPNVSHLIARIAIAAGLPMASKGSEGLGGPKRLDHPCVTAVIAVELRSARFIAVCLSLLRRDRFGQFTRFQKAPLKASKRDKMRSLQKPLN